MVRTYLRRNNYETFDDFFSPSNLFGIPSFKGSFYDIGEVKAMTTERDASNENVLNP